MYKCLDQPAVDIVLATYNGENYLTEFIESLHLQTHQNWRLLISDDGSTDSTVDLIRHYIKLDKRISLVNTIRQGGVVQNFFKSLNFTEANYIAFADQDDVWLPHKIEKTLEPLLICEDAKGKSHPVLVFTDLTVVDEKLKTTANSLYEIKKLNPINNTEYTYLICFSSVFGCTTMLNRALIDQAPPLDDRIIMHDHIFTLLACLRGDVIYCNQPTVLYRQHGGNIIGGSEKKISQKLSNFGWYWEKIITNRDKIIQQVSYFANYAELMGLPLARDIEKASALITGNFFERLKFWRYYVCPYMYERPMFKSFLSLVIIFQLKVSGTKKY